MQNNFFDIRYFKFFTEIDSLELTDEQLRFFHIMVDDYTPAWEDEDEEELKDSIAEQLPFI